MPGRTGRRPGNPDTRGTILAAARQTFAERGFDRTSIRVIAARAGVDAALVHHYFGTKEQLFLQTMQVPVDPRQLVAEVLDGEPALLGVRLVRVFLRTWDSPAGIAATALLRSAMSNHWTLRLLREFLTTQILRRLTRRLGVPADEAALRGALVASQIAGLAMIRHIVKVEPLASAPAETVAAMIGPTVQHYLTGDLSGAS